jgi:hypothetical protein
MCILCNEYEGKIGMQYRKQIYSGVHFYSCKHNNTTGSFYRPIAPIWADQKWYKTRVICAKLFRSTIYITKKCINALHTPCSTLSAVQVILSFISNAVMSSALSTSSLWKTLARQGNELPIGLLLECINKCDLLFLISPILKHPALHFRFSLHLR